MTNNPEPIILKMESIAPEPITMGGGINLKHDWYVLINSSPFQMYCGELSGNSTANVEAWIGSFVENEIINKGEDVIFSNFSTWHSNKGCWKNEDVYGNIMGGDS